QLTWSYIMALREKPHVVIIFHPTSKGAETNHRFKFFSYGRLQRINVNIWCRILQQRWIVDINRAIHYFIAKSDVDLKTPPVSSYGGPNFHAYSPVLRIFGNPLDF